MSQAERQDKVRELQGLFAGVTMAILAEYRGMTVTEISAFRRKLRAGGARFRVAKNTLSGRASEGTPLAALKEHFKGPVGILYTSGDPAAAAKAAVEFAKTNPKLVVRIGVLEGQILDAEAIRRLAELPSREVMLAKILGGMNAPAGNFVRTLAGVPTKFVRVLDAIRAKKAA